MRSPLNKRVRQLVLMLLSFHNLYTQTVLQPRFVCVRWWINGNKATIVQRCHVSLQQLIVSQICRFYWFFKFSMENCKFSEANCWLSEIPMTKWVSRGLSDTSPALNRAFLPLNCSRRFEGKAKPEWKFLINHNFRWKSRKFSIFRAM